MVACVRTLAGYRFVEATKLIVSTRGSLRLNECVH